MDILYPSEGRWRAGVCRRGWQRLRGAIPNQSDRLGLTNNSDKHIHGNVNVTSGAATVAQGDGKQGGRIAATRVAAR
jgi:hypothetical protein